MYIYVSVWMWVWGWVCVGVGVNTHKRGTFLCIKYLFLNLRPFEGEKKYGFYGVCKYRLKGVVFLSGPNAGLILMIRVVHFFPK